MTQNSTFAARPAACTCGAGNLESCLCGTTAHDWFAAANPAPVDIPVTESYAAKRSRIEAENDAFRARGSKLARKLLALMTARMDAYAKGPKAEAIAIARLEGAAEALAALHGYTPHAWEMAVIRPWQLACKTANRPVMSHGLGGNQAILAWEAEVAEAIDAELAKLGL